MDNDSKDEYEIHKFCIDYTPHSINNDSISNDTNNSAYTDNNNASSSIDPCNNNTLGINNDESNTSEVELLLAN